MAGINNRIFYSCQGVGICPTGQASVLSEIQMVHGLQSAAITTNFNLEQVFELGQLEIYENIEGTPDVEITLEKILDGYPLIYHLASSGDLYEAGNPANDADPGASGLAARSKARCDVYLGIFDEADSNIAGQDAAVEVAMTGMYISSVSYNFATDGNFTESVTLVGNNKKWLSGGVDDAVKLMKQPATSGFDGNDSPFIGVAFAPSGGVQRREDFVMEGCILPLTIDGIKTNTYGNGQFPDGSNRVHLQSVSVSTDFSRDDVLELGRKTPYYRPANFPIEVTTEIEAITLSGDFIGAYEFGDPEFDNTANSGNNLTDDTIFIITRNGVAIDLGDKNKISSVSYGGGDAGGGNASVTYSYTNFNELDVQNAQTREAGGTQHVGKGYLKGESNASLSGAYDWAWKDNIAWDA